MGNNEQAVGAGAGRRPTLKTIAYMTGLGVTTVSRALNDAPDIGQATKERVRLVAQQIGYGRTGRGCGSGPARPTSSA